MTKLKRQGSQKRLRLITTIVRVELGVKTLANPQMVSIRNKDHTLGFRTAVNTAVLEKLEGLSLRYFHAEYNPKTTDFSLLYAVPDEAWA